MKQPELRATLMSDIKLPEDEDEDEYLMRLRGYLFGTANELNGAGGLCLRLKSPTSCRVIQAFFDPKSKRSLRRSLPMLEGPK